MKGATIALVLAIIASYSYGSLLSNFDPEKLNIKIKKSRGTAGIVAESVQLVKDHFIRRNVLDSQQWKQIIQHSNTMNNTLEVMRTLIDKLEDPYSRYFGKPSMSQRSSKYRGVSVSTGISVARTLRLSNIGHSLRRSILSNNTSMSTFAKVKLAAPLLVSAAACMRVVHHVMLQDLRMAAIPASISVAGLCSHLYQHAVSFEVTSIDDSAVATEGIVKGDQLLAVNGRNVLGLSQRTASKLLNDGEYGDSVTVTLGRSGMDPPLRPAVQQTRRWATPMRYLRLWNPLRRSTRTSPSSVSLKQPRAEPIAYALSTVWREVQVNLTRQYIPSPSTLTSRLLPSCGSSGSWVGYISIGEFNDQTFYDVTDAFNDLKVQRSSAHNASLNALVFDLRGNPGGPIVPALDIAASFLPKGAILTQLASHGRTLRYHSTNRHADLATALLLLVDERTASASEILIEALCENGRAATMGCRTVGKNVAQAVMSLSDGSGLCFTVSEHFSPSGRFMGNGHTPDIVVQGPLDISKIRYNASSCRWTHSVFP